ncbi:hypothetical protein TNCV_5014821 [Trichonephila clavipes]|nr:hypothetical protein TNCV_5014821 [Trichonephila clavipes]
MPPNQQCQIEAFKIHLRKEQDCTSVVSRSFEHHTGDNTIWIDSCPNFEEEQKALFLIPQLHERTCGLSYMRAFGDGPRHFDPRSSYEDDTALS